MTDDCATTNMVGSDWRHRGPWKPCPVSGGRYCARCGAGREPANEGDADRNRLEYRVELSKRADDWEVI